MSKGRRHGREAALQILYFCEVGRTPPAEAVEAFFAAHEPDASDAVRAFAAELVHGTVAELGALDALIEQHSQNWRIDRLAVIDRIVLRMAVWELRHDTETPPAVVLNEAIELARRFSTEDSARFVNGLLDGIRKTLAESAEAPGHDRSS